MQKTDDELSDEQLEQVVGGSVDNTNIFIHGIRLAKTINTINNVLALLGSTDPPRRRARREPLDRLHFSECSLRQINLEQ